MPKKKKKREKNNVIVFNVEESGSTDKSDEIKHDMQQVENVFKIVDPGLVWKKNEACAAVTRLGKRKPTLDGQKAKPRPIRVTLQDSESRNEILRNARNLKGSKFQRVGISADKTLQERKVDQAKWLDFKERKARGEDVIWHKGQISSKSDRITLSATQPVEKTVEEAQ